MANKFLPRGALIDLKKSEERTNAKRKREGLENHPVRLVVCGCPDPNCGGWHTIVTDRLVPTSEECAVLLSENNKLRKRARSKPVRSQ